MRIKCFAGVLIALMLTGCGSNPGFFDGLWDLVTNGCDPEIEFSAEVTLSKTGTTVIVDEEFEIYLITSENEEDENGLIGETSEQFFLCLDPVGEIDPDECLQFCAGDAMDDDITFFCETSTGLCGPVTYQRI